MFRMALPRPPSIFDAAPHPSVCTGVNIAYPESFRKILGIAVHGRPNGPHQVIMRGAGDQENEDLVDAATELSRQMMDWLKTNTTIVVDGGGRPRTPRRRPSPTPAHRQPCLRATAWARLDSRWRCGGRCARRPWR